MTVSTATTVLRLARTNKVCKSRDKGGEATGCRGKLTIPGSLTKSGDDKTLHTIERADGYVSLPPGRYDCNTGRRGSNDRPCVHISHSVRNDRGQVAAIVIHVANKPHELAGCIAPGLSKSAQGVISSEDALKAIFDAVGASDTQLGHATTKRVAFKLNVSGKV